MASFLDPKVVSRIKDYGFRARRRVDGFLMGVHKSPKIGISMEFRHHREYVQGDDLRHLDWKVFARTDKFYIREYESETNLTCYMVLDCSESMSYRGEGEMSKFEYAATMSAALAYLLLQQRDAVGFTFFDKEIRAHIPPAATYSRFQQALDVMDKTTPSSSTMTGNALAAVGANMKRAGVVVIFSDFLDETAPIVLGLNQLHFYGHEVIAVHISDPWEVTFPFSGPAIIEGLENTGELKCDPSDYRQIYLQNRKRHLEELRDACRRLQFDFCEVVTSTPVDESLAEILLMRKVSAVR